MTSIKHKERELLCKTMASFFAPPEAGAMAEFQKIGGLRYFQETIALLRGDPSLSDSIETSRRSQTFFADWAEEYGRLFSHMNGQGIPLMESSYKPWTRDPDCHLSFAREKGLLQGDSALHVSALYQQCGMELAEEFKACPDHLAVELEFLSFLYRWATDHEIRIFIGDHLDWVPLLKKELSRFHPHPAYALAMELLDLFLNREKERLRIV
jgi:TorA maturation chaperone TorD